MKTFIAKFMVIALAILAIPAASFAASRNPTISLVGVQSGHIFWTEVGVFFDSNGANYDDSEKPIVYVEYRDEKSGDSFVTASFPQSTGSRNAVFRLMNLSDGTEYTYRAVMKYDGRTYRTDYKSFTTPGDGSTTTNSTDTSLVYYPSTAQPTPSVSTTKKVVSVDSVLGISSAKESVKNAIYTAGSNHANGVAIGISDTQARVSQGDRLDFTVQVQNAKTISLSDTELVIQLPEQYEFVSSSTDADYDERDNTITFATGRVPAGTLKTITFKARAVGDGNHEVRTTATWYYNGGKISASDRDAYNGGSKSVLGASVYGAGFFPQTFGGWLAIVILITIIIIVARRYMVPKPVPVQQAYVQPQR